MNRLTSKLNPTDATGECHPDIFKSDSLKVPKLLFRFSVRAANSLAAAIRQSLSVLCLWVLSIVRLLNLVSIAVHNSPFQIFTAISSSDKKKKLRSAKPHSSLSSDEFSSSYSTKPMASRNTATRTRDYCAGENLIVCSGTNLTTNCLISSLDVH